MRYFLISFFALAAFVITVTDASAKRKKVYINKPSQPSVQPVAAPLIAVPPIAVTFDLIRRTSCDPRVAVSIGKNDPGWPDSGGPLYGNFLIPAIYRKECLPRPGQR